MEFPFRKSNTEEEEDKNQLKPQEFHRVELNSVSNSQSVDEEDDEWRGSRQDRGHGVVIDMQILNKIERQEQEDRGF